MLIWHQLPNILMILTWSSHCKNLTPILLILVNTQMIRSQILTWMVIIPLYLTLSSMKRWLLGHFLGAFLSRMTSRNPSSLASSKDDVTCLRGRLWDTFCGLFVKDGECRFWGTFFAAFFVKNDDTKNDGFLLVILEKKSPKK